jgi:4-hydroxybenzoate polyprenyltransferase
VYAICILFDIRDREEDRQKRIRALPTILSGQSIMRIYYLSLLFSFLSTIMMLWSGMPMVLFICMMVPIIICIFLYHHSIARKDDMFYYVILDGLMMLSALLLFVYLISFTFVPGKFP